MQTMLLPFIEKITKHPQDYNLASRHKMCANMDGFDLSNCGWPYSRVWTFHKNGKLKNEMSLVQPPTALSLLNL